MKFLKFIKNIFLLFLLKLMKTHVSVDYEYRSDNITLIYAKKLFGKIYNTKRLLYKNGKLIDKSVANLLDLLNGVNTIEEGDL